MSRSRKTAKKTWLARSLAGQWKRSSRTGNGRKRRKPSLMNTDFKARDRSIPWQRFATPMVALGLAAGLMLTTLRTDIVRMEYELAAAGKEEQRLLGQQRRLTVEHRSLLDPNRLGRIAKQRGFVRPERVIEFQDRMPLEVARAERP